MRAKWAKRGALGLAAAAMTVLGSQAAIAQLKSDGFAFLEAVRDRDGAVATDLLNQPGGTLANSRDRTTGENALHIVTQRRDAVWIRFLAQHGVNPNTADENGVTPLQIAVQLGFAEGAEALLDAGAHVDPTTATGETPLINAVHQRDVAMVRLLMSHGADPDRSDNSGRTARDYAALRGEDSPVLAALQRGEAERGATAQVYGPDA